MPNPIKVWHLTGGGNGKSSPPSQLDDTARRLLAGGASGVVTKSMTAPLERIKILLQLRSMSKVTASSSSSILGTMRSVLRDDGIRGFWKGNGANCTRVIPVYALKVRKFHTSRLPVRYCILDVPWRCGVVRLEMLAQICEPMTNILTFPAVRPV